MSSFVSVFILFLILSLEPTAQCSKRQGDVIGNWALKLGNELHELGKIVTRGSAIKTNYHLLNAQVERKDPKQLLVEIVENISRMMTRKMDAIRCIIKAAENASENFEYNGTETKYYYYNSKYSPIDNETELYIPDSLQINVDMYKPMYLNNDTHFYNIPVNTNYSAVHVPVYIFDRHKEPAIAIQWSEELDKVFVQNYNSDPALSWQYFGSSSGIMRHFPAMNWKQSGKDYESGIDLFDCRIRTWFIEAATCTKDVIILFDSSGSMEGMRKHLATHTVFSILDTFSNNDYINIMNYSTSINYTVPCFSDMLVQATKENIQTFKQSIIRIVPENKSNVSVALEVAFELLARYREKRGCENSSDCNQAIMMVTDGIAGNLSQVFDEYNRLNNGSNIPVRIFTYLIGKDVTNVNEIMWAACVNRGYYAHVQSLGEVNGAVFKYIPVIARPLVLQDLEHPVSWTHAYADISYDDATDNVYNEPYRLLTSVAAPAFDRKVNNNDSITADILGVAGTDVPIDDFRKLMMQYKIGVMAYAFIVSNNGYVLMHPSLRPVFNKTVLKENYNSVDLAEVEQHDDKREPRDINPKVLELREKLVNGVEGSIHDAQLKYHYDNMRRIAREVYDYYFAPLVNTPFSIGIAVPDTFGNFSIRVRDEIQRNRQSGTQITTFFKGNNWKIHPKWVYCKYHYLEGHEYDTPENELLHFLAIMHEKDFKWERQYEATKPLDDTDEIECGRKTLDNSDYYCDKDLIQRLIFDAKNTMVAFNNSWTYHNKSEEVSFKRYNATLRFVATMSGLTRWEYLDGEENDNKTEFGDKHARAIDETWYKSAVLQHQFDKESYVYTVPFEVGESENVLVTGSYAIFPKDGGIEAPGSVVGLQFPHNSIQTRFFEITSEASEGTIPCGDLLDCYVVDSSGYIIISHNVNDTGYFFGEIEGAVMKCMLNHSIFEEVTIYDFQGWCLNDTGDTSSDGGYLQTPLDIGKAIVNYVITNIFWAFLKTNLYQLWDPNWVMSEEISTTPKPLSLNSEEEKDENEYADTTNDKKKKPQYYACDLKRSLYILDQRKFSTGGEPAVVDMNCVPWYYVKRIKYSNLILVAINSSLAHSGGNMFYTTDPEDIVYAEGIEHPCQKLFLNTLPRRRLSGCFNENPMESEIRTCGRSSKQNMNSIIFLLNFIIIVTSQIWLNV